MNECINRYLRAVLVNEDVDVTSSVRAIKLGD
jgi:hypothetical protein